MRARSGKHTGDGEKKLEAIFVESESSALAMEREEVFAVVCTVAGAHNRVYTVFAVRRKYDDAVVVW